MILWLHYFRPRPAWYELAGDEQQRLATNWHAVAEGARVDGADFLGEYAVRGQSTQERVQVWRFAAVERLEAFWSALLAAGYADWRVSENVVGVPEIPYSGVHGS
jgi:hypothetical protein